MKLDRAVGFDGGKNEKIQLYSFLNAHFQAGYSNPLDKAILSSSSYDMSHWRKVGEIPYDFIRKRLSVICEDGQKPLLIAKGAAAQILSVCNKVELSDGTQAPWDASRSQIDKYFEEQTSKGSQTSL